CSCSPGTVRDETGGCKKPGECFRDIECPSSALCKEGKCQDVCEGACGINSQCQAVNHQYICTCPPKTQGDPLKECVPLECVDSFTDCPPNAACIDNGCQNP